MYTLILLTRLPTSLLSLGVAIGMSIVMLVGVVAVWIHVTRPWLVAAPIRDVVQAHLSGCPHGEAAAASAVAGR